MAWTGEESAVAAEIVVAGLNADGGVLGEQLRVVAVDDHCDADQAVGAAHKLVAEGVDFVVGHLCSAAAIPASRVRLLTEQGFSNVFRVRQAVRGAARPCQVPPRTPPTRSKNQKAASEPIA